MPNWWLRVPLYNTPLTHDMDVHGIGLRPRLAWYDARRAISDARHSLRPYVATADAIVDAGGAEEKPSDPWGALEDAGFYELRDALRFLLQRDISVDEVYFHQTADCSDEPLGPTGRLTINMVPYAPNVQTTQTESWLGDATLAWADDALDEATNFRYAARFQHVASMPGLPLETEFLQQWIAFELLFNRWCETDPRAPKDVRISDGIMKRKVRPALKQALSDLCDAEEITQDEAKALARDIRSMVRENAERKATAYLSHIGVDDVPTEWLKWGIRLRNTIAHGHSWRQLYADERPGIGEPHHQVHLIGRQTRLLVNRAIMELVGYEPGDWLFAECRAGFYRTATGHQNGRAGTETGPSERYG